MKRFDNKVNGSHCKVFAVRKKSLNRFMVFSIEDFGECLL